MAGLRFFGSESAATISRPAAFSWAAAIPASPVVAARASEVLRSERRESWTGDMNFTPEMRARRAFPLGPRHADLKTATSAVSTLIRGLYSNDFTLRVSLKKQYASRTPIWFSPVAAEYPQPAEKSS